MLKERWFGRLRLLNFYIFWNDNFFDPLSNFDELGSARLRMRLKLDL
jgi:hypothetical protein